MTTSMIDFLVPGLILAFAQIIAALPWLCVLDPKSFWRSLKDPTTIASVLAGGVVLALVFAWLISENRVEAKLQEYGRYYGALLHLQLIIDLLVIAPRFLILIWPKGGAVALATFREGWRQPMFWLITILASLLMVASMVIPYFTFGEDYKMMKQLTFDVTMLSSALFGLLASSISINEEIEGRTAITVMSKPISRRQFIIGKYLGTLMACGAMTLFLGWVLSWCLYIKPFFDKLDDVDDVMPRQFVKLVAPTFEVCVPTLDGHEFGKGIGIWFGENIAHHVGLLLTFGQVMVLLAICTALATRMQFVVNLVICLFVFLIGHLAPVLVQVTSESAAKDSGLAINIATFLAKLFNTVFPALEYFDMGPAIVRGDDLEIGAFSIYVASVLAYALLYSAIGLVLALILFEDRDLA